MRHPPLRATFLRVKDSFPRLGKTIALALVLDPVHVHPFVNSFLFLRFSFRRMVSVSVALSTILGSISSKSYRSACARIVHRELHPRVAGSIGPAKNL